MPSQLLHPLTLLRSAFNEVASEVYAVVMALDPREEGSGREYEKYYRKPFQAWEMWPSPYLEKPVGSEVWWAGRTLTNRFSRGESGLHCT